MKKMKMRFLLFGLMISLMMGMASLIVTLAEETKGNTIGNLDQGGYIVKDGDWLFMETAVGEPAIRKVKIDGSDSIEIPILGKCLGTDHYNIVDGWLYYTKNNVNKTYICKRKISGGEEIKLCSSYSFGSPMGYGALYVYDSWIYYIENKGHCDYIYRMKTDGTKKTAIVKTQSANTIMSFCIDGQWLYYIDLYNGLYKLKLDGKSKKCLKKGRNFQKCDVSGAWIFYYVNGQVYKIKKDGSKHQKFLSSVGDFNINNGWVYYDSEKGLCKIKTDGRSKQVLVKAGTVLKAEIKSIITYSIIDDCIYFHYVLPYGDMGGLWFRANVNTDGTDLQSGWLPRKYSDYYDDPLHQYFDTPIDPSQLMDPSDIPDPEDIFDPIDLENDGAFGEEESARRGG